MRIDGKAIADKTLAHLKQEIASRGLDLVLAAIVIGNDPAIKTFARLKERVGRDIGVRVEIHEIPAALPLHEVFAHIKNADASSDGVFIELPVPREFPLQGVLDLVSPEKDVDVLSLYRQDMFYSGDFLLLPPAVNAVSLLLEEHHIPIQGKTIAVFGQGILVGKPISFWLERSGATVIRIDEHTQYPEELSRKADVVISGVGKPGLITGGMVREGALVIDFGYGAKDGRMTGDVDMSSVESRASLITPVPGGMGPLVIASLFENLLRLATDLRHIEK